MEHSDDIFLKLELMRIVLKTRTQNSAFWRYFNDGLEVGTA